MEIYNYIYSLVKNANIEKYYNEKTKKLILPPNYNFPLFNFPLGIKSIIFDEYKTTSLSFLNYNDRSKFNHKVDNLPNSITKLIFGYSFNQPIDNLPSSLTHLKLGWEFNQPIDNLPSSLTHLILGWEFNQPIDNLPSNLTHLILGWEFNQPIDNLPSNLTKLNLGIHFEQSINNLPPSLKFLSLYFSSKENPKYLKFAKIPFGCKVINSYNYKNIFNDLLFHKLILIK